jgi:hypothetical protein
LSPGKGDCKPGFGFKGADERVEPGKLESFGAKNGLGLVSDEMLADVETEAVPNGSGGSFDAELMASSFVPRLLDCNPPKILGGFVGAAGFAAGAKGFAIEV